MARQWGRDLMSGLVRFAPDVTKKATPKVAPTVRASSVGTVSMATTMPVTIPATAVVGDLALFFISSKELSFVTAPSGYTLEMQTQNSDSQQPRLTVFSRRIETGDAGSSVNFISTISDAGVVICVVVKDAGPVYSTLPKLFLGETGDHVDSTTYRVPSVWMGPDDLMLGAAACQPVLSYGKSNALLSSVPSGATILQNDANTINGLFFHRGLGVFSAGYHAPRWEGVNWPNAVWMASCALVIAPVDPRWADVEHGPSSLEGKKVYHYGTSSGGFIRHPAVGGGSNGFNTNEPWPKRVADALGSTGADFNNMCQPGAMAADICSAAYGTKVIPTRTVPNDTFGKNQAITATALADRGNALYLIDQIGNDILQQPATPQALYGAINAAYSLLRLLRSSAVYNAGDGSCTYSGTWSTLSSDGLQGGAARLTTAANAQVSIAVPAGNSAIDLVLAVEDNTALGTTGANCEIYVDGVLTQSPIFTNNQMHSTGVPSYTNYQRTQMTLAVENLDPGTTHTVVLKHIGSAGHRLIFNCWMTRNTNPPWIVTNLLPQLPAATYTQFGLAQVTVDMYEAYMQAVVSMFPDGRVILYKASEAGYWNVSTHFAPDGLHQNEVGEAHYGHEILRLLRERVPSPPAAPPPPPRPSEVVKFTSAGTTNWTCPADVTEMIVQCVGGGGGGSGGGSFLGTGGGGGKGGSFAQSTLVPVPGNVYSVTVGAGGAGTAINPTVAATAGGVSSFGSSTVVAAGGNGGGGTGGNRFVGATGNNGTSVGQKITSGTNGSSTANASGSKGAAGGAGATPLGGQGGAGGQGGPTEADNIGNPGLSPGGAGGGGMGATSWGKGGNGANGAVNLILFFD